MIGRRRRGEAARSPGRRRGPAEETRWWDETDQRMLETLALDARSFGRGWVEIEVVANEERLDPWQSVEGAEQLRALRASRTLRALDEGRAWRQRSPGALAVLRAEAFADDDPAAHIGLWMDQGAALLQQQWRARWRDREVEPGWVEATMDDVEAAPSVADTGVTQVWFRIEDHTDPSGAGGVTCYEHLSQWRGRRHAVLVVRHDLGSDLAPACRQAAMALADALGGA